MPISYHGIVGSRKTTLPSVEDWGRNTNILRDPPKSIQTRRIDKVNQAGELNTMFYHSGDRFAENLTVYAKGVNPMVSVEYQQSGLSKGIAGGFSNPSGYSNQLQVAGMGAKLPYRILDYGAFRPPILTQEQLLPLSRLPRNVTKAETNRGLADYSKTLSCAREKTEFKEINPEIIHTDIRPTIYKNIAKPMKEHFEVNYVIENPTHYSVSANPNAMGNTQTEVMTPTKFSDAEVLKYSRQSNKSGIDRVARFHEDIILERNVPLHHSSTNISQNIHKAIEAENEIILERNVPVGQMYTNQSSQRQHVNNNAQSFNRLRQSIQAGGFDGAGVKPQIERSDEMYNYNNMHGNQVMKKAAQFYEGRY